MIFMAKRQFYTDSVLASQDNPKKLWKTMNSILHRKPESILPDRTSDKSLADRLCEFFIDNISKIRSSFPTNSDSFVTPDKSPSSFLSQFSTVSEDEVRKIINSSPTKSCSLDPWPTFLVKEYVDVLIKPITQMVNYSLSEGVFPERFKSAVGL